MQSASNARTSSSSTVSSLSYIDSLVTDASSKGIYRIFVDYPKMSDDMMSSLISDYGYNVIKRTYDIGNFNTYIIQWDNPIVITPAGGSGTITFNGTNAYVRVPNATLSTWLPDLADFTVEWFLKRTGNGSGFPRVFSIGPDTAATLGCSIEGGTAYIWCDNGNGSGQWMNGGMSAGYNNGTAWSHIALSRISGVTRLYIDGQYKSKSTDVRHINGSIHPGDPMYMGGDGVSNWFQGELTNFRWVNTGLYGGSETTITVPSAPLANIAQTKLLLLGGSVANPVVDAASINTLIDSNTGWSADTPF